jgi:uracil-DNA glycosylase
MLPMSDAYNELLDAAIQRLHDLKMQGVRFVPISQEGLAALNSAPTAGIKKSAPAPTQPNPVQLQRSADIPVRSKVTDPAGISSSNAGAASPSPIGWERAGVRAPVHENKPAAPLDLSLPGAAPAVSAPPLSPEAKTAAFAELRQRALACVKCEHLASSRKNVVFGVGSIDAQLMFVGEAPGADEDEQAEPFVGKAGQLLTKIIQTMGLQRGDVYIANILKCRPDTPGQSAGNRKPTPEEMKTCIPYLHEQIDLIRPKVLVALGATAVEGLLGKTVGITRLRGNWQVYRGIPLMPTYHPAFLLRNQALSEKRRVWEDMLQVMEKLAMPISDKQKNFFLKAS